MKTQSIVLLFDLLKTVDVKNVLSLQDVAIFYVVYNDYIEWIPAAGLAGGNLQAVVIKRLTD